MVLTYAHHLLADTRQRVVASIADLRQADFRLLLHRKSRPSPWKDRVCRSSTLPKNGSQTITVVIENATLWGEASTIEIPHELSCVPKLRSLRVRSRSGILLRDSVTGEIVADLRATAQIEDANSTHVRVRCCCDLASYIKFEIVLQDCEPSPNVPTLANAEDIVSSPLPPQPQPPPPPAAQEQLAVSVSAVIIADRKCIFRRK